MCLCLIIICIFSPSTTHESDFATFHSTLVKKGIPKQAQKGMSVSFSVKALRGNMEQLRKDFALLINKNTIVVNKLGFPDVILPGKCRQINSFVTDNAQIISLVCITEIA